MMRFRFSSIVIHWRGPAPYLFAPLTEEISLPLREMSSRLSYGWGCIPVRARLGQTEWRTSLMPRQGIYLLPIKVVVQHAEAIGVGSSVEVELTVV